MPVLVDNRIEDLQKNYFEAISLLQDENDIISALPKPEYKSFFTIMEGLLIMITNEINETEAFINTEKDESCRQELIEDLKLWKLKFNLCKKIYMKARADEQEEEDFDKTSVKGITFASTLGGSTFFERDLKSMPGEYYDDVLELLRKLKEGEIDANEQKEKQLTNNNALRGVREKKGFKVRIAYRILDSGIVYVMLVKMKKSDNDRKDVEVVVERKKNTNSEFERLKDKIKEENFRNQLISDGTLAYERIKAFLESNQRGSSNAKK